MKILYVLHQYFPRHVGGTEVYARGLVRRARRAGHQVEIISYHESSSAVEGDIVLHKTEYEGCAVKELHYNLSVNSNPARNEYLNLGLGRTFGALVEEFKPDLVHIMHAMKLSASVLDECHKRKIAFVLTLCDFWFICPNITLLDWQGQLCSGPDSDGKCLPCVKKIHGPAAQNWNEEEATKATKERKVLLQTLALKAERIFALSEFQKRVFVENGYPAQRIEVLTHGLELADLDSAVSENPAPSKTENLRIGFVGHLVPQKGVHILLEAICQLQATPLECHIYGPLRHDAYVRKLAALAIKHPGVRLFGELSTEKLGAVIDGFDVMVLPALWYENQPLVVKAAMHKGVPVIASNLGSLPEMLQGNENCWLVEPGNVQELSSLIQELAANPPRTRHPKATKDMDAHAEELFREYENTLAHLSSIA